MALNTQNLYKAIRNAINSIDDGDELTAVVKARSNGTRKQFPFATMDIVGIVDTGSYLTNKTTSEDNGQGKLTYQAVKDVTFQISVRGKNTVSYRLAQKLHFGFTFDDILAAIRTDGMAVVADVSDITTTPDVLNTRLQEINSFNVTLRTTDENVRNVDLIERSNITSNTTDSGGNPVNTP